MKKSRPWNLNKESILKPSFNTFISPHKIIDISARVDKKKNSFNNRYKSNIFKDCVNFICYSEFFFIWYWYMVVHFLLTGACRS